MNKKVLVVLSVMFTMQTFLSCCDCEDKTFENFYTDVFLEPFYRAISVTEGERIIIDENSNVSKSNFSMLLSFERESN